MKTPMTSKHFEKSVDPACGLEYYVLATHVAEYQQGFYFVNNSMTRDGRYLWFYCSNPPVFDSELRQLGYVDFETDEVVFCPDTLFTAASPYVDGETGEVYFTWKNKIYRRAPKKDAKTEELYIIPVKGLCTGLATHLTVSPDGREFLIDFRDGNFGYHIGSVDRASGEYREWTTCDFCSNHAQFNPVNGNLALYAYDHFSDRETGETHRIPNNDKGEYERLWTVTRDGKKTFYPPHNNAATHEWWSGDGKKIYYVNGRGIHRINTETGEHIVRHACHPWHAHTDAGENYYIFDDILYDPFGIWYRGCPAAVRFYNARTDREATIISRMPENEFTPQNPCRYHIDPHPRIQDNEKYVVFSTTERGGVNLAIIPMETLLEATGEEKK